MRDDVGIMMQKITGNTAGDKDILANPVIIKNYILKFVTSEFKGIYDMERGSAEVGFENDMKPLKYVISIYHVEIKRM